MILMRNHKRAAAIGIAAVIGSAGIATAATLGAPRDAAPAAFQARLASMKQDTVPRAQATPHEQIKAFALLRGARTAADRMPVLAQRIASDSPVGANPDLARHFDAGTGGWLVPGTRGLCLVAVDPGVGFGGTCTTTEEASAGQLQLELVGGDSRSAKRSITGVLPDDAAQVTVDGSDGQVVPVSRSANIYTATSRGPVVVHFERKGTKESMSLGG